MSTPLTIFYSDGYVLSTVDFDTTRKAKWVAESLALDPIAGVTLKAPAPLTARELLLAHDPDYVAAVRDGTPGALAASNGLGWDAGLWPMTLASNGGVLAAARLARRERTVAGSLSSGLHHARRIRGSGFCTFNGLAVATRVSLEEGARAVLVIDLDAHCGGGTTSILGDDDRVRQLDIATSSFDHYAPRAPSTLDVIGAAADYLPTLRRRLAALTPGDFDLAIYNAGMDPFERCDIGGLPGVDAALIAERERTVFDWCRASGLPIAFVLAGGYTGPRLGQAELVSLHRLTIDAAARSG